MMEVGSSERGQRDQTDSSLPSSQQPEVFVSSTSRQLDRNDTRRSLAEHSLLSESYVDMSSEPHTNPHDHDHSSDSSQARRVTKNEPGAPLVGQEPSILSVVVHYATSVKAKLLSGQLAVKLSFVDRKTGKLVKKSDRSRPAVSYYETSNPCVDYILPLLTHSASCVMNRSVDEWLYKLQ